MASTLAAAELMDLQARLRAEAAEIEREREALQERLDAIEVNQAHIRATLDLLATYQDSATSARIREWGERLRGLSIREALDRIAEQNRNILETAEAGHILIAVGLWKGKPDNVRSVIYHHMQESGRYKKIDKGRYRLVAPRPPRTATAIAIPRLAPPPDLVAVEAVERSAPELQELAAEQAADALDSEVPF